MYFVGYFSRMSETFSPKDVPLILQKSVEKNRRHRLHGFLVVGEGWFYQVLEGQEQDVNEVFGLIQNDPRHRILKIERDVNDSPDRMFRHWRMGVHRVTLTVTGLGAGFWQSDVPFVEKRSCLAQLAQTYL